MEGLGLTGALSGGLLRGGEELWLGWGLFACLLPQPPPAIEKGYRVNEGYLPYPLPAWTSGSRVISFWSGDAGVWDGSVDSLALRDFLWVVLERLDRWDGQEEWLGTLGMCGGGG